MLPKPIPKCYAYVESQQRNRKKPDSANDQDDKTAREICSTMTRIFEVWYRRLHDIGCWVYMKVDFSCF